MTRKFLGIHDGHNCSAAILIDGNLIAAIQEERLTRSKDSGGCPEHVLDELHSRYDLSDSNGVALAGEYRGTHNWNRQTILSHYAKSGGVGPRLRQALKQFSPVMNFYKKARSGPRKRSLPGYLPINRVSSYDHHLTHAATAYYGLGQYEEPVLVVTCDGSGDEKCASVYCGRNGALSPLGAIQERHSIGRVYSYITYLFNMVPYEHEYKIMGLAPYATDQRRVISCAEEFAALFSWVEDNRAWRYAGNAGTVQNAVSELRRIYHSYRFDHLAGGLQLFIEEHLSKWINSLLRKYKLRHLALAGGVFMNIKANEILATQLNLDSFFVFPSCGDESLSIGACYLAYKYATGENPRPLGHFYLDPYQEHNSELANLKNSNLSITRPSDIEFAVASLLATGQIVARVCGSMEFGARALGNRSILANPSKAGVVRSINEAIKGRDFWMPFAPSVMEEDFNRYFDGHKSVRCYEYMMCGAKSKPEVREYAQGALHSYDFSGRPQKVSIAFNPRYHQLLKHYKELTGESLILNTSFNLHGHPIVRTAGEAIDVLEKSGLRFLAVDSYLIEKLN